MVLNGMDLSFLDNIDIKENSPIKTVRFNKNELYMLKFHKFKGLNFSNYIKMLITRDIQDYCNKEKSRFTKEDIENIVKNILKDNNEINNGCNCNDTKDDKYIDDLELLGLKKR